MRILKLVNPTRKDAFDAARDGRYIHIVCRFNEDSELVIITAYALTEEL